MEAIAEHNFEPEDQAQELAFKKGDRLLILNYGEQTSWLNAVLNGRTGMVPENYIKIDKPSWYYGKIARIQAEELLQGSMHDGAFLVRLSESSPTEFSLSVKCGTSVQHFRILKDSSFKYFLWNERFDSLNKLVEYYRKVTVSRTSQILLKDMHNGDQYIVRARYDFIPDDNHEGETELAFKKGDLITVFDDNDENWWGGCIGGRSGFFPKLYVERYEPTS